MVSAATGNSSTVAGTVNPALTSLGDGGPATSARLAGPVDVAFDKNGNLYIADLNNLRVRMVAAGTGVITTVAGNGQAGDQGDGGPALSATVAPEGLAVDLSGNLYVSSYPDRIREVVASSGVINTIAGNGYLGYTGDGGAATMAELSSPTGLAFDSAGNLSIAAYGNNAVRKVTFLAPAPAPTFSVPAGTYHSVQAVSITDSITGAAIY
jgi:sugar lactone lactonase YvrE